jgi:predicted ATPase/DNA-binding NarL/FixJ family response regulator
LITHGGRLPAETSRFFGRSEEAAAIKDALASSRLVTLTGPGGIGKTRLAVQVAGELGQAFPDGVFLADFSAARDAAGVADAMASALGMPRSESQQDLPSPGWLASPLRGKRLLLILDTCEHVLEACAALADAILRGGGPGLLVTSRQPLDLPGEVVFRIPPLSDGGDGGDAVRLFADRAAAAVPGFEVTQDTLPRLVRLCRLLDGIPLAIELAALRLRAVGLDELLVRLPGHLRLLGSGRRAATGDRQQSLQASVGWSYDLCSPAERLLWARLSVFADGFGLAAAEEVCSGGALGADEILDTLVGLVDKSIVLRAADTGGAARYRLLAVVREHGAAHADDADSCAGRHRAYYAGVARAFAASFVGPGQLASVTGLVRDEANLRAAFDGALAAGDTAMAMELATACWPWLVCAGRLAEAGSWLARALEQDQNQIEGSERLPASTPASPFRTGVESRRAQLRQLATRLAAWCLAVQGGCDIPGAERDRAERQVRDALSAAGYVSGHAISVALSTGAAVRGAMSPAASSPPRSGPAGQAVAAPQSPAHQVPVLLSPGFAGRPAGPPAGHETGPEAVNAAFAGRWELLTAREREVAGLVAKGLTNKDIASRLFVSKRTVDAHLEHILGKLGYSSRLQVAALASHEQAREHS